MVAKKSKSKAKAKSKVKPKAKLKIKTKVKPKAKPKTKSKVKAKSKSKSKPKARKQVKAKAQPKKTHKAKPVLKASLKKSKLEKIKTSKIKYSEQEKQNLLNIIDKIVSFYKNKKHGLGSLDTIDQILSKYNQHYRTVVDKFDAVAEYGMQKDPAFIPKSVFVFENTHVRHEDELFKLLEDIWDGTVNYNEAAIKMNEILIRCQAEKMSKP